MKLVEKITIANELLKYARECNSAKAHNDNSAFEYYNEIFNKRFKKAKKMDNSFDYIMSGTNKIGIVFEYNKRNMYIMLN